MKKASETRYTILENAFNLVYKKGYQTTSIDEIIATTNVTKGAFYYHFKTKDEMGLALVNEIVKPTMHKDFIIPLQEAVTPLEKIYIITEEILLKNSMITLAYGCPAGNLIQEMTPWNTTFSNALKLLITSWQDAIIEAITIEIKAGNVKDTADAKQVAQFVISGYWGVRSLGKIYGNKDCYYTFLREFKSYLNALKV